MSQTLKAMLLDGRLLGSGIQPPLFSRVSIPNTFWRNAEINFAAGSAKNANFSMIDIEITRGVGSSEQRIAECVEFIAGQKTRIRKVLGHLASEKIFGLTQREFTAAFKSLGRGVGRPLKESRGNSSAP